MDEKETEVKSEYIDETSTTSDTKVVSEEEGEMSEEEEEEIKVQADLYGTGKPKRIIIKAKITHD